MQGLGNLRALADRCTHALDGARGNGPDGKDAGTDVSSAFTALPSDRDTGRDEPVLVDGYAASIEPRRCRSGAGEREYGADRAAGFLAAFPGDVDFLRRIATAAVRRASEQILRARDAARW